jgi:hypothetical protein
MMKVFVLAAIFFLLFSCRSSQEIITYEYSQTHKATAHWESKRIVNLEFIDRSNFSIFIIESSFYGNVPFSDTMNIIGRYSKNKYGYTLISASDEKVKFKVSRYKNKIHFKGTYYNKRNTTYVDIKNQSEF